MPYIKAARRPDLDPLIVALSDEMVDHGELNYCISRLAVLFLAPLLSQGKKVGYKELSAVHAVLQDAADEFYAEPISDYEKQKKETNGDVYTELRGI
jgi:hypothetical protein